MSIITTEQAIDKLLKGDLVALPTETVYGLGGLINNEEALKKIFSTKKRPLFDPLIVHVKDISKGQTLAHWGPLSLSLAEKFWPGPLTLILEKKPIISDLITNGGPTVGLRAPSHPIAQKILTELDQAFAAPSANLFGQTSPTCAQHVLDEFNSKISVVDGGSCEKGIESTIIEINEKNSTLTILRPGVITSQQIKLFLTEQGQAFKLEEKRKTNTPGNLNHHYQPSVHFILLESSGPFKQSIFSQVEKELNETLQEWTLDNSAELAARQLYKDLRHFSSIKQPIFLAIKPEWKDSPSWTAILDRLQKACHFHLKIGRNGSYTLSKKD